LVEGDALRSRGTETAAGVAEGDAVLQGDALSTKEGARLEVTLGDGSVVRLDESSRFVLDEAALHLGGTGFRASLTLAVGSLWARVTRRLEGESSFEVKTDRVTAGVRGTEFLVEAREEHAVHVIDGSVEVGVREERGPQRTFLVGASHRLRVERGGVHAGVEKGEPAGRPHGFLRWSQDRDAGRGRGARQGEPPGKRLRPGQRPMRPEGGPRPDLRERTEERRQRRLGR
jgi:ferric-dicitrate binding protein FerR (iron transport regulator)